MSGQFLSEHLGVDLLHENPEVWQLNEDFHYKSDVLGELVCVPKGFVTDFASVPRLPVIWWLFGGIAKRPAVIHDYLYSCKDVSRSQADAVLKEAMEANGDGWFNRSAFWAGVRVGGSSHKTEKFSMRNEAEGEARAVLL